MQLQLWVCSFEDSGDSKTLNVVTEHLKPCMEMMLMIIPYLNFRVMLREGKMFEVSMVWNIVE